MVDWKTYKGEGPWPFAQQPNKWGYLNNPRWMKPSGAPVSYDGREDEEPQVWSPSGDSNKDGQDDHFPCGHWHKIVPTPLTSPPTTPAPISYIPWFSCPQAVVYGNNTDDIFYTTTDHDDPVSTLYVIKYNRSTGLWEVVYTTTAINDTVLGVDFRWLEPPISQDYNGSTVVLGFIRAIDDGTYYRSSQDIFVFDGETLLNNTILTPVTPSRVPVPPFYFSHWLVIDNTGRIHVIRVEYGGGTSFYYDYYSDNNGASFTPVLIFSQASYYYNQFITVDVSGNLWVFLGNNSVYRSTDNGLSWSSIGSGPGATSNYDFKYLNDALFIARYDSIQRSTNGSVWASVQAVSTTNGRGGVLAFDGTYYYALYNHRSAAIQSPGTTTVYRSSDGVSWSVVSTFSDDSDLGPNYNDASFDISARSDRLVATFYYSSTTLLGQPTVYMMTVWESVDSGVTWTPIQTPFYDLTTGTAPI